MKPDAAAVPLILQTELERHVDNRLYPAGITWEADGGRRRSFCGLTLTPGDFKFVRVPLIPPAAVCPDCVSIARRWYASGYFEPFTTVQRRRLLDALTRDLATTKEGHDEA
jgi:hypothetical protein